MTETKNNDERFPEVKPTKPGNDTAYIAPIIGKLGYDTRRPWLFGLGTSPNNGVDFHVFLSFDGLNFDDNDIDKIWNGGTADRVKKEVDSATAEIPAAVSAANSAVSAAESAVAASKVNSDAIVAQSEAISEARSTMDSATAEIQQTAANAASDAAKIRADVAQVQSEVDTAKAANSASVEALKSDVSAAKQDLADVHDSLTKAQSAIEQNQKLINDSVAKITSDVSATKQDLATVHDSLMKAQAAAEQNQKAINDSIAEINANVDATNQDLAGVRKDLTKAQSDITANQKAIDDNVAQISDDITQDRKDIADVRQGLTKAQSDITANQKAIDDNVAQISDDITQDRKDIADVRQGLTKAQSDITANQKAVNDNVAQINSNIEQDRKDIASAQQANADTAKQLDTYSKQAATQGKTIKSIQDKQDSFTATLADVQGNVSQVSDKVDGLSASLKDTQGNVATVKAQADQLNATLTDHAKSIATLTASAKELSSTLEDADGRLNKVEQTAQTNSSTLSDVQGDLSQVKQNATKLVSTLKDAQGNISTLQQKADSLSTQLVSAQGDIATLQTGVDSVKATLTSHDKSIHTLQADSKSLKDSMADAQGDISTLSKTATDVTSELEDHTGRLSKVEQSAAKQATTLSDLQGNLSQVEQKADSNTATISSINKNAMQDRGAITDTKTSLDSLTQLGTYSIKASGLPKMPEQHYGTLVVSGSAGSGWLSQQFVADTTGNVYTRVFSNNAWSAWKQGGSQDAINQVKQTADSNSATIRNVQGDVSTLKQTATGIKSTLASHEGDIHTLQADSKSLKDSMTNAQGDISTLQKSATSLDSEMKDHAGRLSKVEQNAATQATTLSDLQGNLSQVKQQADGLVTTLKDAQGDITQIQQKADGMLEQLKSAQGDIASLQTDVTGIKATLTSHEGDIHTLQADSKTLKDDMKDAQGNISSLQKSSTKLDSEMSSQDGRLSKVEQTAKEHTTTISDLGDKLNNIQVGGRNLVPGTAEPYAMGYGIPTTTWRDNSAYLKLPTTVKQNEILPQDPRSMHYNLIKGTTYTQTVWFETDAKLLKENGFQFTWFTNAGHDRQPATLIKLGENRYKVFSTYIWPGKTDNSLRLFDLYGFPDAFAIDNSGTYLKFTHLKLEEGNQSTDWTPAPEDLATVTQVKQTADGIETTLKNAQGDIDQIKQTAKGTSEQLSNVQGNVTNIQKDVNGLKQTTADNAGNIHTLQSDSKTLKDDMQDAQGDISTLKKTSTDVTSELKNHAGRISKAEQTAATLTNELADQQGHLSRVEQTAQGTQQTVANQQGQINNIKTDASGIHETLTGQGNQIANINVTLNGLNTKYEGVSVDLNKLKSQAQWATVTSAVDLNNVKTPCHEFLKGTVTNAPNESAWWYLTVEGSESGRITQTVIADQSNNRYTRRWADGWSAWVKDATQTDVTALSNRITTNSTQITQNKQAIALKADQSTVNNLSGEVSHNAAQLKVQAGQISSKVASTDFKTLNDKVNNIQVGGRNLITGTSSNWAKVTNDWGPHWALNPDEWKAGDTITISAEIRNGSQNIFIGFYNTVNGQTNTVPSKVSIPAGKEGRLTFAYKLPEGTTGVRPTVFPGSGTGTFEYRKLKAEKGNVATDWTPAPEDLTTAIQKNSTAIDQTNQKISLKADQTEVDKVKNTATQNSSRLDVMANEISSKVTSTDVDNIVDKKGYATMSYAQTLVKQTKDQWNVTATDLDTKIKDKDGINLLTGTADFTGNWFRRDDTSWTDDNWRDTNGNRVRKRSGSAWNGLGQTVHLEPGNYTFSLDMYLNLGNSDSLNIYAGDTKYNGTANIVQILDGNRYDHNSPQGSWFRAVCHFKVTEAGNVAIRPELNQDSGTVHVGSYKLEKGLIATPWTPAPSDNASVTQISNLQISIDGIQSTVSNKADKSQITQLSNVIQSKVNASDFTSKITQLSTDINARVTKGDLLSQFNLEAGRTLIQSNKIYMDANSVIMGPNTRAFIPSAAIINLDAAKIESGFLHTDKVAIGDNSIRLNVANNEMTFSGSSVNKYYQLSLQGNSIAFRMSGSQGYDYRISHGVQKYETDEDGLDFDVNRKKGSNNNTVLGLSPSGVMVSPSLFFQTNNIDSPVWMGFTRNIKDGAGTVEFHTSDDEGERFRVDCGARFEKYLYINGYARAQGWLNNSTLSKKTNIAELDTKVALDTIRQDKQYTYEYRQNVERGENDPQASFIIDDVNAVSQYTPPKEFLDRTGKYREPAVELSYLVAAVQELDSQVQKQAKLIKELKEKANE